MLGHWPMTADLLSDLVAAGIGFAGRAAQVAELLARDGAAAAASQRQHAATPLCPPLLRFDVLQLHQVEHEAKQDVKARAGRRSRKLDQGIILLLFVSCLLAAFEAGMKMNGHLKGRPAGSIRGSAHKAAACADS